jgi:predicted Holliday junction resolvase-like endonuclease
MTEPAVVLLALASVVLTVLFVRERLRSRDEARRLFERWSAEELGRREAELSHALELRAEAALDRFQLEHEKRIREDAVRRSQSVVSGKTSEQLVPFLPDFPFDPRDARFLGSPVDLVVFDGLSGGDLREIVFVEVKTGPSAVLSTRERRIRNAVDDGRVRFRELRLDHQGRKGPGSLLLPLRAEASEPSGQLEIEVDGSEIRYWSDWSEPPLTYPLDPALLVPIVGSRYALRLRTDETLPHLAYLVLEDDVRLLADNREQTLSVQFGDDATVTYVLETERLVETKDSLLLTLDVIPREEPPPDRSGSHGSPESRKPRRPT